MWTVDRQSASFQAKIYGVCGKIYGVSKWPFKWNTCWLFWYWCWPDWATATCCDQGLSGALGIWMLLSLLRSQQWFSRFIIISSAQIIFLFPCSLLYRKQLIPKHLPHTISIKSGSPMNNGHDWQPRSIRIKQMARCLHKTTYINGMDRQSLDAVWCAHYCNIAVLMSTFSILILVSR